MDPTAHTMIFFNPGSTGKESFYPGLNIMPLDPVAKLKPGWNCQCETHPEECGKGTTYLVQVPVAAPVHRPLSTSTWLYSLLVQTYTPMVPYRTVFHQMQRNVNA